MKRQFLTFGLAIAWVSGCKLAAPVGSQTVVYSGGLPGGSQTNPGKQPMSVKPGGLALDAHGNVVATSDGTVPNPSQIGPLLPDPGPGIISNNGGGLVGKVRGPAGLVGNAIVGNNGGGVISNNGAGLTGGVSGYKVFAANGDVTSAEVPYANAKIRLVDAAGNPVLGTDGQPLETVSDTEGAFKFPTVLQTAHNLVIVTALPGDNGDLQAIVSRGNMLAGGLDVDVVSTLTTGYILDKYVLTQSIEPTVTLDKLPADVEATTRAKATVALDQGSVSVPAKLTPQFVDATVDSLRQKNADFSSELDTVKQLLVIGASSVSVTDGSALKSVVNPSALVVGQDGTVYFQDGGTIRALSPEGAISTLAGSGQKGSQDGKGTAASFNSTAGLAIDGNGNMFVLDGDDNFLLFSKRMIAPDGTVTTLPIDGQDATWGTKWAPGGLAIDTSGNLFMADFGASLIREITPGGKASTLAGRGTSGYQDGKGAAAAFNAPFSLACDASGTLYVPDWGNCVVRKVTSDGTVTTLAGNGRQGHQDGKGAAASFSEPKAIAIDSSNNLYVGDGGAAVASFGVNVVIRKVTPDGTVTTLAGSGQAGQLDGVGSAASFSSINGLAVDASGNVYVADSSLIRKVTPNGAVTTIAGIGLGSNGGTANNAYFDAPGALTGDPSHNLYLRSSGTLYKVSPAGKSILFAGGGFGSQDGEGAAASFEYPRGLADDTSGNLYVADQGNGLIRKVTPAGTVTTLAGNGQAGTSNGKGSIDGKGAAASFNSLASLTVDASGNVYATDTNTIRKVTPDGTVTTLAGNLQLGLGLVDGNGSAASFAEPEGLVADANGNLYVADMRNFVIRKVTPDGTVTTFAGSGQDGHLDGKGAAASFDSPKDLAIDASGNLYVAEGWSGGLPIKTASQIRKVAPDGTVTTLPLTFTLSKDGIGDGTGIWVDGRTLWYIDGHQLQSFQLP